ncbi:MAG: S53 family peptidase [Acidimicrobiales bacterium]
MTLARRALGGMASFVLLGATLWSAGGLAGGAPGAGNVATASRPEVAVHPAALDQLAVAAEPYSTAECLLGLKVACYTPSQLQQAYAEGPLFQNGIDGRGQTIAIVDAFGSPTLASDLGTFDSAFGLPDPSLQVIAPDGPIPALSPQDPNYQTMIAWAGETTLDVEWAHVIAPGASILVVETPVAETIGAAGFAQIDQAEQYVVDHHLAGVISQSFNTAEETFPNRGSIERLRGAYRDAAHNGVTIVSAAGDNGTTSPANADGSLLYTHPVVNWPASDPLVTGVGGTELSLDATTGTSTSTVWNDGNNPAVAGLFGKPAPIALAGGGGLSSVFDRPPYQRGVSDVVGHSRGVPDVSMNAACTSLVQVYESFAKAGWYFECGTSESAPLFAGIVALADQVAGHPLGLLNPALYALSAAGAAGIVDVTSGNNTVSFSQGGQTVTVNGATAAPGYDLASGVGTVDAAKFVPELAAAMSALTGCNRPGPGDHGPGDHGHGDHGHGDQGHHENPGTQGCGQDGQGGHGDNDGQGGPPDTPALASWVDNLLGSLRG